MKSIKKNNTWNIRLLVDDSFVPSSTTQRNIEGVTKKSRLTFSSLAAPEATVVHP